MRVKMIVANCGGERTGTITVQLSCHIQTVRKRLARFDNECSTG
jgi:hypothetical protein